MSVVTDYEVLRKVLAEHKPHGWAIEFGVFKGVSLRLIADHMPVIGLDSFAGLPEDWRPGYGKGRFPRRPEDIPYCPNAMIVPGLFADTLPLLHRWGIPRVGLVHIDCDLYSSTVTALEGVLPFINEGTIIVFDEFHGYEGWEQHEAKAWDEFCVKHGVMYGQLLVGAEERAFRVDAIGEMGYA